MRNVLCRRVPFALRECRWSCFDEPCRHSYCNRASKTSLEHPRLSADLGHWGVWDRRTELLDGEIVDLSADNLPHVVSVSKCNRVFVAAFDDQKYWLTVRSTTRLDEHNVPSPDFTVMRGYPVDLNDNIVEPLLIVEVADSTLPGDRSFKSHLYASKQIPEYWIVNLNDRQLEIHTNPVKSPSTRFGWKYDKRDRIVLPGATISPWFEPDARIEAGRMFP